MRLLLQRVKSARVDVEGRTVAAIGHGLLAFVGFGQEDEHAVHAESLLSRMAHKVIQARLFPDDAHRLHFSLEQARGEILAVSQFTLHADCRRGRRPSLHPAASPGKARELFDAFVLGLRQILAPEMVQTGVFGAQMDVILHNWGPLSFFWDSQDFLGET